MRRRDFGLIVTLVVVVPLAAHLASAQQPAKALRIGLLQAGAPSVMRERLYQAFREELRAHGYVDGQNIVIEYRSSEGHGERLAALAAELVNLKVDVIMTAGSQPIRAVAQATTTIPIVIVGPDPVEMGLVASLARPGGNLTGLAVTAPNLEGKTLQLLKEAVPEISRVAVVWNSTSGDALRGMHAPARELGITLQSLAVRNADDFDRVFDAAMREGAEALYVTSDPLIGTNTTRILAFATRRRLPTIFEQPESAEEGGLMAYGPSLLAQFRLAAAYVDKILKGARPGDLAIEQLRTFDLVINLKTAEALGITIAPTVLQRANEVIR